MQAYVDDGDVIVKIPSIRYFVKFMDARQSFTLENDFHSPIEYRLCEISFSTSKNLVNLHIVQFIPKTVSSQDKVLMKVSKSEMCQHWCSFNIRPSEHRQVCEVILFELKIKIAKRTSWLKPSFHITGCPASNNIRLIGKFLKQTQLLKFFTCI